jgi:hypothetical protein
MTVWPEVTFEFLMAAVLVYIAVLSFTHDDWFLAGLCVAGACFAAGLGVQIIKDART